MAVRVERDRVPGLHTEREIRVRERENQDRENQADRRSWDHGRGALRLLRGLRDRLEAYERDDGERDPVHQIERGRPCEGHRVNQQLRLKGEEEAEEENQRFAHHIETAHELVECGALAHADDVEQRESGDHREHDDEVHPRMIDETQDRYELTQIVDAAPREEHDIDREVEQDGPPGDEAEDIAEPAEHEVLSAAGHRVGGCEFRIREADAHVDDAGEKKRDVPTLRPQLRARGRGRRKYPRRRPNNPKKTNPKV